MKKDLRTLKISDEMIPAPEVVELDDPISRAVEVMRVNRIRHVPVVAGDRVVGLVSDRALKAARLSSWADKFTIADVMIPEPYAVHLDTDLDSVIRQMMADKIESAIVLDNNDKLAGIFTTIDALRVLHGLLGIRKPRRSTSKRKPLKLVKRAG